jgi:hypothetical protein
MRIRTADPLHAMQMLYQLSYAPDDRERFRSSGDDSSLCEDFLDGVDATVPKKHSVV